MSDLLREGGFDVAVARAAGRKPPCGLAVFFPADDGRQDLMHEQQFGLEKHRGFFRSARAKARGPEAALLRAYIDLFLGRYRPAAAVFARAASRRPDLYWPNFLHCAALWLLGDQKRTRVHLPEALAAADRAVSADPRSLDALVLRAGIRRELEDNPGRLEDTEAALKLAPRFVWLLSERAETLGETGQYARALREYGALIRRFPRAAWPLAHRARLKGISGKYRSALRDFDAAVARDAKAGPVYAWRAEARRRLGDYAGALEDLDRSIALDPGYRLPFAWRGRIHLLLGRPREAAEDLTRALRIDSRESLARSWRGEAWWKLGRARRAAEDFHGVFPSEPHSTWNARLRERQTQEVYFLLEDKGGSRREAFHADLAEGLERRRGDPWAWAFSGRCKVGEGRVEEGIAELETALKLDPGLAWARLWLGEGLRRAGAREAAAARLRESLRRRSDRWGWAFLGRTLGELGRGDEALDAFAKAEGPAESRFAVIWAWRAEALYRMGRLDEAREAVRRGLIMDGKCHEALELARLLEGRRPF